MGKSEYYNMKADECSLLVPPDLPCVVLYPYVTDGTFNRLSSSRAIHMRYY